MQHTPVETLTSASLLQIRLFGWPEALSDGAPLPGLRLREGERLLAYLTLHHSTGITHRTLAQQFWPFEAQQIPGTQGDYPSTRQAIRSLRQALGTEAARLQSQGKGIISFSIADADVDVIRFDALVQSEDVAGWREAVSLHRAPLLEQWNDAWAVEARKRRLRSYERILRRLVAHDLERNADSAAEENLYRLVAHAPLDEAAWRDLMRVLSRQNHSHKFHEAYETLRRLLAGQGREPEAETEALINASPTGGKAANAPVAPATHGATRVSSPDAAPSIAPASLATEQPQVALLYKHNVEPDETVMRLLERDLTAAGYHVFVDRNLPVGIEWAAEIERQVRRSHAIIPLLSHSSVRSEMLEHEIEAADAAAQTQNGQPRILPVRIRYEGRLPANSKLALILDPIHSALWNGPDDDRAVVDALLDALQRPAPIRQDHHSLEANGGAVALDSRFYIVRPTDHGFLTAVQRQDSIVLVKGARQMGKTSLLARGLQQARHSGARIVLTDFQMVNEAQLESPNALFFALATTIALQLDLDLPTKQSWDPDYGANINLESFLRRKVLNVFPEPFVWGMDEVDRLFTCPFGSEVFGLFRSWHNKRALDPHGPWSRLTLAISYATEAHLFITDINQSPFNVGTRVALQDFTPEEVAELNVRYGRPLRTSDELARFYRLFNGQPYLVRRGFDAVTEFGIRLDALEVIADRDDGPFGDHLRRVLALLARDSELTGVVCDLLRGHPCPTPESFYRLRSAGLMAGEWGEEMSLRCQLYASYLARHLLSSGADHRSR